MPPTKASTARTCTAVCCKCTSAGGGTAKSRQRRSRASRGSSRGTPGGQSQPRKLATRRLRNSLAAGPSAASQRDVKGSRLSGPHSSFPPPVPGRDPQPPKIKAPSNMPKPCRIHEKSKQDTNANKSDRVVHLGKTCGGICAGPERWSGCSDFGSKPRVGRNSHKLGLIPRLAVRCAAAGPVCASHCVERQAG